MLRKGTVKVEWLIPPNAFFSKTYEIEVEEREESLVVHRMKMEACERVVNELHGMKPQWINPSDVTVEPLPEPEEQILEMKPLDPKDLPQG